MAGDKPRTKTKGINSTKELEDIKKIRPNDPIIQQIEDNTISNVNSQVNETPTQ